MKTMDSRKQGETRRDFLRMLAAGAIVLSAPSLLIRDTHVLKDPSVSEPASSIDAGRSIPTRPQGPTFEPRAPERKPASSPRFV
jgi:hypothetical protein